MRPDIDEDRVAVYHGDSLEVLRGLPDASVDAVVTDPPYGLGFMGKEWDGPGGMLGQMATGDEKRGALAYGGSHSRGYADNDSQLFQAWCEGWVVECLRVLKPGGHMLAFGGTRTWHRLACSIEDAGFKVRDSIAWLYGSGFPKSLDVSKAIDKAAGVERQDVYADTSRNMDNEVYGKGLGVALLQSHPTTDAAREWQGWGTALKPAHEPIVVARKPLTGTVAANVLEHGTGALNIDGCRIGTAEELQGSTVPNDIRGGAFGAGHRPTEDVLPYRQNPAGRWPANVVLDENQAAELDGQSGNLKPATSRTHHRNRGPFHSGANSIESDVVYQDGGGGASRFFYVAKAPAKERPKVDGVAHPTVKPLTLMRWLCRLVTPPNGLILEPFAGSGTTIEAALLEGFRVIAIEREADYLPLIQARLDRVKEGDDGQLTFDAPA